MTGKWEGGGGGAPADHKPTATNTLCGEICPVWGVYGPVGVHNPVNCVQMGGMGLACRFCMRLQQCSSSSSHPANPKGTVVSDYRTSSLPLASCDKNHSAANAALTSEAREARLKDGEHTALYGSRGLLREVEAFAKMAKASSGGKLLILVTD